VFAVCFCSARGFGRKEGGVREREGGGGRALVRSAEELVREEEAFLHDVSSRKYRPPIRILHDCSCVCVSE
jgi:hypothetical protein